MTKKTSNDLIINKNLIFKIKFAKNKNKSSLLSIHCKNNNHPILKNIPIILPLNFPQNPTDMNNIMLSIFKKEFLDLENNLDEKEIMSLQKEYDKLCDELTDQGSKKIMIFNMSLMFSFNHDFSGEDHSFIISEEDYDRIVKVLLRNKKEFDIMFKPAFFDFLFKNIKRNNSGKTKYEIFNLANSIKNELFNKIRVLNERFNGNKTVSVNKKSIINNTNQKNDDEFGILLSFLYPEMAIIFRPFSILSWVMYANSHTLEEIQQEVLNNNISTLTGFELVKSAEFENKEEGYQVVLFDDENKENIIGVINVDNENICKLSTPNGDLSCLSINNNGVFNISYLSENNLTPSGDPQLLEVSLVKDENGEFTGNWISNHMGNSFDGGLKINEDFNYSPSDLNELPSIATATASVLLGNEILNTHTEITDSSNDVSEVLLSTQQEEEMNSWDSHDPYAN